MTYHVWKYIVNMTDDTSLTPTIAQIVVLSIMILSYNRNNNINDNSNDNNEISMTIID